MRGVLPPAPTCTSRYVDITMPCSASLTLTLAPTLALTPTVTPTILTTTLTARFGKYLPSFADVLINERDEYLAQSLLELSRLMQTQPPGCVRPPVTVVAVVGAGHLPGIQKWLACGGVSEERIAEISSSSKHTTSTWPGKGRLRIVDTDMIFDVPVPEAGMALPQQTPHAQQQQQPPPPPPLFSQPQAQSQS